LLELAGHPSRSSSLPALDLGRDLALCFSDKGTEIAVPHIRGDDDAAFAILAADLVRAGRMDCGLRNDGDRR
jgi:hypothetical protein